MSESMWWDPDANDGAGGWRLRRDPAATQPSTARRPVDTDAETTVVRPRPLTQPPVVQPGAGAGLDPLLLARIGFVALAGLLGVLAQLSLHLFDFLAR